jgi:hypothetical protein
MRHSASPEGTAENLDPVFSRPSRDFRACLSLPRTMSWATFTRPYGTKCNSSHADTLAPDKVTVCVEVANTNDHVVCPGKRVGSWISEVFRFEELGVELITPGLYRVFFRDMEIGELNSEEFRFRAARTMV